MTDLDGRLFVRRGNALFPADAASEEWLRENVKDGKEIMVTARKVRNPKHHKKTFALLKTVLDNSEGKWASIDDLLSDVKMATRMVDVRIDVLTGQEYIVPRSIAFASLDQISFGRWYKRALYVLSQALSVLPDDLAKAVDEAVQ